MNEDRQPPKQSSLLRYTGVCLNLLGSILLSVAGVLLVRWSLTYAGVGKFTIMGGLTILVGVAFAVHTLRNTFKTEQRESKRVAGSD